MLAGFEEIERLVKLESGRLESEPGETDLAELVGRLLKQLEPATVSRQIRLSYSGRTRRSPWAWRRSSLSA
jgi:hypothetical protein